MFAGNGFSVLVNKLDIACKYALQMGRKASDITLAGDDIWG